jgi:hypothetical protein
MPQWLSCSLGVRQSVVETLTQFSWDSLSKSGGRLRKSAPDSFLGDPQRGRLQHELLQFSTSQGLTLLNIAAWVVLINVSFAGIVGNP